MKLVSLGLAVLLWLVIAGEKTSEIGVQVPLELQNFPRDLELTGEPVNEVEVRLRASPGIIQRLTPGDISAQVDVADATEGERIVHLTPESIRVPFGVRVVKITPSSLTLEFERTVLKIVPVRTRLLGEPAPGFEVAEVGSDPTAVTIMGPRGRVADVDSAFTEPIAIDGVATDVTREVNIGLDDPLVRIQGVPRVRVTAEVRASLLERILEDVPVEVRGGQGTIRPEGVRVILSGPAAAVRDVPAETVKAFVDLTKASAEGRVPVNVELGPGHAEVGVLRVEPAEVDVQPARRRRG